MNIHLKSRKVVLFIAFLFAAPIGASSAVAKPATRTLVLSRAEYLDRVKAIWTAQMIGQLTGLRFEHKPASVLANTPLVRAKGFAAPDDDYYYEMVMLYLLASCLPLWKQAQLKTLTYCKSCGPPARDCIAGEGSRIASIH